MDGLWKILQLKLVLGDIILLYSFVLPQKLGFNNEEQHQKIKYFMECSFCVGWLERTKNGLLLLSLKSKTL